VPPDFASLIERVIPGIEANPYIPLFPSPRQAVFLGIEEREALFGGAAGGGKSIALLMDALQYAQVPGYAALLMRRTYPELAAAGGLIPVSKEWLGPTNAVYNESRHQWTFPGGVTLSFTHVQNDKAADLIGRGPTYQGLYYDEATTFSEYQYRTIQSRLRRPESGPLSRVPLKVRAATNPGGESHSFFKQRFLVEDRPFVRSLLTDNPGIDQAGYRQSLEEALDPVQLARMLDGDWDIVEAGEVFDRGAAPIVQEIPRGGRFVRFWDLAGSVGRDSAYTAGVLMCEVHGYWYIVDVQRFKRRPDERDDLILQTAHADRERWGSVLTVFEQEPADAGIKQANDQVRMLAGFNVKAVRPTGDKVTRAGPVARQYNAGNVRILSGPFLGPLLDELGGFPSGKYKDQADALGGAFGELRNVGIPGARVGGTPKAARFGRGGVALGGRK